MVCRHTQTLQNSPVRVFHSSSASSKLQHPHPCIHNIRGIAGKLMMLILRAMEHIERKVLRFARRASDLATLDSHRETGYSVLGGVEAINHSRVQDTPIFHPKSTVRLVIQEGRLDSILVYVVPGLKRPGTRLASAFQLRRNLRQDIGHRPADFRSLSQFWSL